MNELSRRIGKFDSPESLLKAYQSLEAEFTKRSQRLREIEKENESLKEESASPERFKKNAVDALSDEEFIHENVLNREDISRLVINRYLTSLCNSDGAKILNSSVGKSALTPPSKPKNLQEAKRLADIIINQ